MPPQQHDSEMGQVVHDEAELGAVGRVIAAAAEKRLDEVMAAVSAEAEPVNVVSVVGQQVAGSSGLVRAPSESYGSSSSGSSSESQESTN